MQKAADETKNSRKISISNLKEALTLNRILIIIIVIGIVFRIVTFWTLPPMYDGNVYTSVGYNIANTGEVMVPWGGDYGTGNTTNLGYTKTTPVYPSYLAFFYVVFGYSIDITQIAGTILGIITLLIIYLTTKDLFGHQKGLIVTAIMSVTWPLITYPGMEWGDNMVVLFFVLTLWSFLKGLKDSRYMILVGLFGGVLFLTKVHGVHFIFILALVVGFFLWRYLFMRKEVFKDKNYYFGALIFLLITGAWLFRNYMRFSGSIQGTSSGAAPLSLSMELLLMFILKFLFLIILAAVCALYWLPELRATLSKVKKENYNALWVFAGGFFLLIWLVTSLMGGVKIYDRNVVFRLNHIRYIVPIYIPLLWLVIKDREWSHQGKNIRYFSREILVEIRKWLSRLIREKKTLLYVMAVAMIGIIVLIEIEFFIGIAILFAAPTLSIISVRKRLAIMLLVFFIASVNAATTIKAPPHIEAAKDLQVMLKSGDTLMIDDEWQGADKYNLYPYLAEYDIRVMKYDESINATYIFSYKNRNYTGYELIEEYYWEGELGIIIKVRDKILGLFISRYREGTAPQEIEPSAWLWKKT